ncbi:MAG: crossover junction endodeoxyribonuclease RuvC [Planctomycetota bacterium]
MRKKAFPSRNVLPQRVLAAAGLAPRAAPPSKNQSPTRPEWPVVLGIDPGTRIVGFGAVQAHREGPRFLDAGAIHAGASSSVPERLGEIQARITQILARIRPDVVVVERAFAARNVQSALRIGEGRGVALACAAAFGAEVIELAPAVAKKALVGHGAADKSQVARMVAAVLRLKEPPRSEDATDALALALAHLFQRVDSRLDGTRAGRTKQSGGAGGAPRGHRDRALQAPA